MSDLVSMPNEDLAALCKAYARVVNVRMGDRPDWAEYGTMIQNVVDLTKLQERLGVEMMAPAKMDRMLLAFKPDPE